MAKIVYSPRYGGFGISKKAAEFMAERGHAMAQKELDDWAKRNAAVQQFKGTGAWPDHVTDIERSFLAIEAKYHDGAKWFGHFHDLSRTDPLLVEAVETLGDAASGDYASLAIREIPDGSRYRIDEYDGNESVMTPDDYEWSVA